MKPEPIQGAKFQFLPAYSKPAILKQEEWLNSVKGKLNFFATGVIVDADQDNAYVTFISDERGWHPPTKDYKDKNGDTVNAILFPKTAIPYRAIQNFSKDYIIKHFHPDNPEVQQEFKFEKKIRTFNEFINERK